MSERIIIEIRDGITEAAALDRVAKVTARGRESVSNGRPCFCFVSTFTDGTVVYADLTRTGSDKFVVYRETAIESAA